MDWRSFLTFISDENEKFCASDSFDISKLFGIHRIIDKNGIGLFSQFVLSAAKNKNSATSFDIHTI